MTRRLRRAIEAAAATLADAGIGSARTDAELLAAHVAGTDRGRLAFADEPDAVFFDRYRDAVAARARRMPLQHITGTVTFGPVRLEVGPGVFIPRPETEALLEWAAARTLPPRPIIVDLCTGSGALAAALAFHRPDARVIAVDDDPQALRYARRNVCSTAIEVAELDVTDTALLPELDGAVDLLVANPPYLPDDAVLEPEVARHDPAHALFGGGDGMAVIAAVVCIAARWLADGGHLAVEHDDTTSAQTMLMIQDTAAFTDVTPHRDLAGRPRFVTARRSRGRRAQQ